MTPQLSKLLKRHKIKKTDISKAEHDFSTNKKILNPVLKTAFSEVTIFLAEVTVNKER